RVFAGANRGKYIMVAAPGVDVMVPSPDNQYTLTTGTSVAAANVSGVAALLMEGRPNLEPETLRYLLVSTAKALNARSREEVGSGLVDPVRAIAAKPPEISSPEVTSSVAQPRRSAAGGFPGLGRWGGRGGGARASRLHLSSKGGRDAPLLHLKPCPHARIGGERHAGHEHARVGEVEERHRAGAEKCSG